MKGLVDSDDDGDHVSMMRSFGVVLPAETKTKRTATLKGMGPKEIRKNSLSAWQ
jgi:hypothetical protein